MIITGVWDAEFVEDEINCRFSTTLAEMYELVKAGKIIYLHVPAATIGDVKLTEVFALIGEMSEDILEDEHYYNLSMAIDSDQLPGGVFDYDPEDPGLYIYNVTR